MKQVWVRIVKFGFRLLYHELAWTYDVVSWVVSLGEWRHWQLAGLAYTHGRSILEVGHGPGHLLLKLAQDGYRPIGVDISLQMGQLAKRRLEQSGYMPLLVRASVADLPFEDGRFDTIFSTFPTDYIVQPEVIHALYRVLANNGRLIIIPEGHLTQPGVGRRLVAWLYRITNQADPSFFDESNFKQRYALLWQQFTQPFLEAGFEIKIKQHHRPKSSTTIIIALKV